MDITLRDYLAGQVLQGIMALNPHNIRDWVSVEFGNKQINHTDCLCEGVYQVADAMLKARDVKHL